MRCLEQLLLSSACERKPENCKDINLFIKKKIIGHLLLPGVLGFKDILVNKTDNLTIDIHPEHIVEWKILMSFLFKTLEILT